MKSDHRARQRSLRPSARPFRKSFYHGISIVVVAVLVSACGSPPPKSQIDPAKCGNGELDGVEACDPGIENGPGACPASCDQMASACGAYTLQGSADECTARCEPVGVACGVDDGCCPTGCTRTQDADCPIDCAEPTNANLAQCMSDEELRAICESLPTTDVTCPGGQTVNFDGADCGEDVAAEFPSSCMLTSDELKACFADPCALIEGRAVCLPVLACAVVEEDPEGDPPPPIPVEPG